VTEWKRFEHDTQLNHWITYMKIHVTLEWRAICIQNTCDLGVEINLHSEYIWPWSGELCVWRVMLLVYAMRVAIFSTMSRLLILKFAITYQGSASCRYLLGFVKVVRITVPSVETRNLKSVPCCVVAPFEHYTWICYHC
jgi:hypothetical protein